MAKVLHLPLLFLALDAYAQTPEPPVEKAGALTVVIFVVVFVGLCASYLGYAWWSSKRKREDK
jgi:flagellar basal body-associated protein FliL